MNVHDLITLFVGIILGANFAVIVLAFLGANNDTGN